MARKAKDLSGQRFDRLTVILKHPSNVKNGHVRWECLCDPKYGGCGNITIVNVSHLKNGHVRSCGCFRKENKTTHGFSDSPEYGIWNAIKKRCYNPNNQYYSNYGGRGITMSDEWKESFEAFYRDMGPRPSHKHTIDRRENDKGYSKDNCRWATRIEQNNNRKNNIYYEFDGERKTLGEWCSELDLNYDAVYYRLQKGMEFEDALDDVILNPPAKRS